MFWLAIIEKEDVEELARVSRFERTTTVAVEFQLVRHPYHTTFTNEVAKPRRQKSLSWKSRTLIIGINYRIFTNALSKSVRRWVPSIQNEPSSRRFWSRSRPIKR
jgi:hypothetical protein